jgi:hypothetical protein
MMMITFDDALDAALALLRERLHNDETAITFVRDVTGQLTAILDDNSLAADQWNVIADALHDRLGVFSPGMARVLLRKSDLIDEADVFESPDRIRVPEAGNTWLIDRLISNQEWLRQPRLTRATTALGVGFSLKGGVGRSTALGVLAWHFARQGKRVLAVDLDLEAPGLGSILLADLPAYGLVDWLVNAVVSPPDETFLRECIALSPVASESPGLIQVLPAFGTRTKNYVAKVGRVFIPTTNPDDGEVGFTERLDTLVRMIARQGDPPDVVLLDSRAGLHDVGAAAVTQLGAEVFMFARDEPQGWTAYRLLFQHLARSKGVAYGMPDNDLRWRLKMVAAQLEKTEGALSRWTDASYETWSELYDDESRAEGAAGPAAQSFPKDETTAPHYPLPVYFDAGLRGMNLTDPASRPPWPVIEAAFGVFLTEAANRLVQSNDDHDRAV